MSRFAHVAFDLYGTLLDVAGLAARLQPLCGDGAPAILAAWRKAQLELTWRLNREGVYRPWDAVTAEALLAVAPGLAPAARERMCETWLSLPAFPDARAALEALGAAGVRRLVLSNGTRAMIDAALTAVGLPIDGVLCADDVRAFKTDPRVYALLPRERALFVSGNGWDAEGAKQSGLTVAWIDRGSPPPGLAPDVKVASLAAVAAWAAGA